MFAAGVTTRWSYRPELKVSAFFFFFFLVSFSKISRSGSTTEQV